MCISMFYVYVIMLYMFYIHMWNGYVYVVMYMWLCKCDYVYVLTYTWLCICGYVYVVMYMVLSYIELYYIYVCGLLSRRTIFWNNMKTMLLPSMDVVFCVSSDSPKISWLITRFPATFLPKLLCFLPRLPRVLFRSPGLTPRIANSHDGNKACPRYFSRSN